MVVLERIGLWTLLVTASAVDAIITSEAYFYGLSPPVYPSPNISGHGTWAAALQKAQALVSQMTLQEKVSLTSGTSSASGCSGFIPAVSRLGFPGMCLSDAGNGLRSTDLVNGWASGISVGASWNRDLAKARGYFMGSEFKSKGVNVALGPVAGPLGRVAEGGRNWEGFANDPYLSGALTADTVSSMQSAGVITSVKHFIGNEQETDRSSSGSVSGVSSNIDDQTLHELYLWPFQDAVLAGTANIMCSYNKLNGSYACQNSKVLNGILKEELGFQGFVVSDWGAQHSGVAAAAAGLDVAMPSGGSFWGNALSLSVQNGSIIEDRLDDMITRVLTSWYKLDQDVEIPVPGFGMGTATSQHNLVDGRNASSRSTLLQGAIEGHVLLKNQDSALPLRSPRIISVFGYAAEVQSVSGFSSSFGSTAPATINGTLVTGGGSGSNTPWYVASPFQALTQYAVENGTALYWDFASTNPKVDTDSSACLVIGNAFATEGSDRPSLRDDLTDGIILNVARQCNNTIVVFQNPGPRLVDQFIEHPNVTGLIYQHYSGQDTGRALISLLVGASNPSGKLPYTVAKNESDYGNLLTPSPPEGDFVNFPQSNFSEGVYIDYRAFDKNNITPRYEFGFGLSYTTFEYSNLAIEKDSAVSIAQYPTGEVADGGQVDLWEVIANVTAVVSNTGDVDGAEVAQLYVGIPNAPLKQLRGFEKPSITAGVSAQVTFGLTRRDLSIWDTIAQKWSLQSGTYGIFVGGSSRDLPLKGTLIL